MTVDIESVFGLYYDYVIIVYTFDRSLEGDHPSPNGIVHYMPVGFGV